MRVLAIAFEVEQVVHDIYGRCSKAEGNESQCRTEKASVIHELMCKQEGDKQKHILRPLLDPKQSEINANTSPAGRRYSLDCRFLIHLL